MDANILFFHVPRRVHRYLVVEQGGACKTYSLFINAALSPETFAIDLGVSPGEGAPEVCGVENMFRPASVSVCG